jgi:hypothetical protein
MNRKKLIIIISAIILIFASFGFIFTLTAEKTPEAITNQQEQISFDFVKEDEVSDSADYFNSFGSGKLKIITYGGAKDIRTHIQNKTEYALIKNPKNIGGLEFISSNDLGDFYFAKDGSDSKIVFEEGDPEGKFGYLEAGEVSENLIQNRIPSAEYYAAYPISVFALKSGFQVYEDNGSSNNFLQTKYLRITNLNNNRQVVVEIDTRNAIEDSILISEATRKALRVDNGALGSFNLEVVDKTNNILGVVGL